MHACIIKKVTLWVGGLHLTNLLVESGIESWSPGPRPIVFMAKPSLHPSMLSSLWKTFHLREISLVNLNSIPTTNCFDSLT